ncbi:hypothetical protein ASPZODRAFT_68645 [Penicilliopsis zonata CBS 506.65]|uniref:chitinase n=1 Tax=Penicilliopsis zonata CBS 506.65 TaxID=1073090 RepID=A0A1L9SEU4_9EURO|nr:hypothetical protein ASPZODRAFT_68645 [Penicilliopsis zonata CBS 506.65]OJJ45726.1 hypothetical protein ASPZODRAFT_68645 [Penicilliopsis zonata CBS 506.65]
MPSYTKYAAAALAVALPFCSAQTYTSCNPLNNTCSADTGLATYTFSTDFTTGNSSLANWTITDGTIEFGSDGAEFIIAERYDAPTIETDFYFFFGEVEVKMKSANGTGIVSSIVFLSDDLDEIDWEALGAYDDEIETNYFGKDNTTSYDRATYPSVTTPAEEFHTYTIIWTEEKLEWLIDGTLVRTLEYDSAVDGRNYPQTPMRVKLGIWAGGDPSESEGTIEWAGGEVDYDDVPFTMYVESVKIINYNPAETYTYTGHTGSYESIVLSNSTTNSTVSSSSSSNSSSSSSTSSSSTTSTSSNSSSTSSVAVSAASMSSVYLTPALVLALVAGLMQL